MKKIFLYILFFFFYFYTFAQESIFINIEPTNAIIGNDKFKAKLKTFTGVAGEKNEEKVKYYRKEHTVNLSAYKIKKYLVTYEEFLSFLDKSNYKTQYEKERAGEYKQQLKVLDHPVKRVSFFDVIAYCEWYSDISGKKYRLPTSAEWEYAAIANTKTIFPWGNESKILLSTHTDNIIGRENFSIYAIKEDISPLGMANLMGGNEYTLDCYDERFYENSPDNNPLCLIPFNAQCVMRGISEYNNLENDVFGLYGMSWIRIDDYCGYSYFRLVEDEGTVFNKGSIDEAVYNPLIGKASKVKILVHPNENGKFSEYECISDVFILFESKDKEFYRCFIQTYEMNILGELSKCWKIGWIQKKEIKLTNKKWYEY